MLQVKQDHSKDRKVKRVEDSVAAKRKLRNFKTHGQDQGRGRRVGGARPVPTVALAATAISGAFKTKAATLAGSAEDGAPATVAGMAGEGEESAVSSVRSPSASASAAANLKVFPPNTQSIANVGIVSTAPESTTLSQLDSPSQHLAPANAHAHAHGHGHEHGRAPTLAAAAAAGLPPGVVAAYGPSRTSPRAMVQALSAAKWSAEADPTRGGGAGGGGGGGGDDMAAAILKAAPAKSWNATAGTLARGDEISTLSNMRLPYHLIIGPPPPSHRPPHPIALASPRRPHRPSRPSFRANVGHARGGRCVRHDGAGGR